MTTLVDWQKARGARTNSSREIVRAETKIVEKLPAGYAERLAALEARVEAIEDKPVPLVPVADNDEVRVPKAFGDLVERLMRIEERVNAEPAEPAELKDDISDMGQALADMGGAFLNHISVIQRRLDACEARFSELPNVLAQIQAERRRTA